MTHTTHYLRESLLIPLTEISIIISTFLVTSSVLSSFTLSLEPNSLHYEGKFSFHPQFIIPTLQKKTQLLVTIAAPLNAPQRAQFIWPHLESFTKKDMMTKVFLLLSFISTDFHKTNLRLIELEAISTKSSNLYSCEYDTTYLLL